MTPEELIQSIFTNAGLAPPVMTPNELQGLVSSIDETPFPIDDWAQAWCVLARYLQAEGSTLALKDQLHYLSCAAEGAAPGGKPYTTLHAAVEEYISTEGVALAQKKTAP
jgi:hypothetical protein